MTQDDFNTIAWRDFIDWAWNTPEMRAQFTAKTGVEIQAVTTGRDLTKFIEWVTREHWGLEQAPVAYQAEIAAREAKT